MTQGDGDLDGLVRKRIRALRLAQGWSLEELAGRARLSQSTLSRIENGQRRLALDGLVTLARALDTTLDQLVGIFDRDARRSHRRPDSGGDKGGPGLGAPDDRPPVACARSATRPGIALRIPKGVVPYAHDPPGVGGMTHASPHTAHDHRHETDGAGRAEILDLDAEVLAEHTASITASLP
ncbi:helix-turn-helix domain-containing protein [Streptomyces sp. HUAS TT7]|uniref:helix-turn-helix domain-containing protein n=1 Tax=Streptomyces sp. HUAS TT7 TaxID=3447507 RepID=UPI003F654A9E